ncbi:MAG: SUMF1/EgtB/PvdO family nonheme iron enzyme [Thermodesulfobacteriota bacterium]
MKIAPYLLVVPIVLCVGLCNGAELPNEGVSRTGSGPAASPTDDAQAQQPRPAKLFEAVSAYLDGFHRKNQQEDKKTVHTARQTKGSVVTKPPEEHDRTFETQWQLAQARIERREWDLATLSLQRALASAEKTIPATELSEVQHAADKARTNARRTAAQPGSASGELINSLGMRLVCIQAGSFIMGSAASEIRRIRETWNIPEAMADAEGPSHEARLSKPFLLGKYPVTVREFRFFVDDTGYRTVAEKQGWGWVFDPDKKHWVKQTGASWRQPGMKVWDDHPVTMICHRDAEAFCEWLGKRENRRYHLPTEAQWEYSARGGEQGKRFPWGDEYPGSKQANIADRQSPVPWAERTIDDGHARLAPVGSYKPNGFWLYDMVGNVWQCCADYYDARAYRAYSSGTAVDPDGPKRGKTRVVRGGNWAFGPGIARNGFRTGVNPDVPTDVSGFRVAAVALQEEASQLHKSALSFESWPPGGPGFFAGAIREIRELVAKGRRNDARALADKVLRTLDTTKAGPDPRTIVKAVLEAQMDDTEDKGPDSFTNSLGMNMVRIAPGAFVMGSSETDISWAMGTLAQGQPVSLENEYPFHKVRISRPFHISATETTVGQFRKFVEETGYITDAEDAGGGWVFDTKDNRFAQRNGTSWRNPGWKLEDSQPVAMVSYNDAVAFADWLSAREKLPYKLPTEAQWEYAARGGIPNAQFPWGDSLPDGRRANYADSSTDFEWRDRNADDGYKYVAPVGKYQPNGYGLYDMAGNVLEWVRDYYREDYYRFSPEIDPEGPDHAEFRVMRGGEWTFGPVNLRCAFRGWSRPELAFHNGGFRVAVEFSTAQRPFHFAQDFLTKEWVPGAEQRQVAGAVAAYKHKPMPEGKEAQPRAPGEPVKGVMVLDLSPRSDARKAGIEKGDVIIEYDGQKSLTSEKLMTLAARNQRQRSRPTIVVVRKGHEYVLRGFPGALGVTLMDTTIRGPFKKPEPARPRDDGRKKPQDWT